MEHKRYKPTRRIPIGKSDGRTVYLDPKRRSVHQHIIGASGQGKTKYMEHCIRQDIIAGHGVCLIDPEGDLYENILKFCLEIHKDQDPDCKIHLFDSSEPNWRFRFNPLYVHEGEKPRHRVDNVIEALAQVWGGEDSQETPSIRTTLRAIFSVLVDKGYTLAEAFSLTSTFDPYQIVEFLTFDVDNPILDEIWAGYRDSRDNKQTRRDHMTEFSGSRRRLSELLTDNEIRETFAAYQDPIDFKKVMDDGDIVLINLSPEAMGEDVSRAFGALLLREMFYCSSRRKPEQAQKKPFYAYVDECAGLLTRDISSILARCRKRGFHVTLAHQWLEQLRNAGDDIYHGVMGIQNKAVFGGLSDEDAVILADQLFRSEYDLETPIEALTKPGIAGYRRTWLNNWSSAEATTYSQTETYTESTSTGESINMSSAVNAGDSRVVTHNYDQDGWPVGTYSIAVGANSTTVDAKGIVQSSGSGTSTGFSTTEGTSHSESYGASEALEPILRNFTMAVHSLDNVRHMAISRLRSVPPRNAVIKSMNTPTFDIATFPINPPAIGESEYERKKQLIFEASPYTSPTDVVREEMERVQRDIADRSLNFERPAPNAENPNDTGWD